MCLYSSIFINMSGLTLNFRSVPILYYLLEDSIGILRILCALKRSKSANITECSFFFPLERRYLFNWTPLVCNKTTVLPHYIKCRFFWFRQFHREILPTDKFDNKYPASFNFMRLSKPQDHLNILKFLFWHLISRKLKIGYSETVSNPDLPLTPQYFDSHWE